MRIIFLCLCVHRIYSLPNYLSLSSSIEEDIIQKAMGLYVSDGESNGVIRYRLKSDVITRFLYRSQDKGLWSITGSEANILKSKGTIVSTHSSESPIGCTYRYYSERSKGASVNTTNSTNGPTYTYFSEGAWQVNDHRHLSKSKTSIIFLLFFRSTKV